MNVQGHGRGSRHDTAVSQMADERHARQVQDSYRVGDWHGIAALEFESQLGAREAEEEGLWSDALLASMVCLTRLKTMRAVKCGLRGGQHRLGVCLELQVSHVDAAVLTAGPEQRHRREPVSQNCSTRKQTLCA